MLEFYNLEKNTLVVIPKNSGEPKIPSFVGGRLPISETLADEVRKILETEGNWKNFDNEINYWLKRQINVSGIPKRESLFIEIFKSKLEDITEFFKSKDYNIYSIGKDAFIIPVEEKINVQGLKKLL